MMKCCSFREGPAQLHVLNVHDEGRKLHKHTFAKPLVVAASLNRHGSDILTRQASLSFSTNNEKQSPVQKYVARLLDGMEMNLVSKLEMNRPLPETVDPRVQLAGNFAPVNECCVHDNLEVVGEIPPCLDGVYVRNGANPRHEPSAGHHFFDGDGMIHAVKFHNGTASYSCRYTRTYRLEKEENMGRALFPKAIGELHGYAGLGRLLLYYARTLIGLFDIDKGLGVANAGLIFFNGTLLAMSEDDLPYAIRVSDSGDLSTLGRFDFQGQLKSPMIAHPKLDPETGELFTLSYNVVKAPYLKYFYFMSDGKKSKDIDIELPEPVMIHDFAITNKYVVIPDQQMVFRLGEMLSGGSPMVYDKNKPCRFGIMPKYQGPGEADTLNIKWIEVPDCFCFHLWNAWEELDKNQLVVLGSIMKPPDTIFNFSLQHDEASFRSMLSEIRLDMVNGTCVVTPLTPPLNLEAGQVNRKLLGRRTKYAYMAIAEPWPKVSGIVKVDLESRSIAAMFSYDDGCFGGEPFFIPRTSDPMAPEDDGYVVGFVYDENRGISVLLILDASSPYLAEVGCVKIPSRVPYGFHGTFITSQELAMQTKPPSL